jgi:hypothetical protein
MRLCAFGGAAARFRIIEKTRAAQVESLDEREICGPLKPRLTACGPEQDFVDSHLESDLVTRTEAGTFANFEIGTSTLRAHKEPGHLADPAIWPVPNNPRFGLSPKNPLCRRYPNRGKQFANLKLGTSTSRPIGTPRLTCPQYSYSAVATAAPRLTRRPRPWRAATPRIMLQFRNNPVANLAQCYDSVASQLSIYQESLK